LPLERDLGWHLVKGADVMHEILGEPAVSRHASGAVTFIGLAIIQTGGIAANKAVVTSPAPHGGCHGDPRCAAGGRGGPPRPARPGDDRG
jgi:hypothetical protein